MTALPNPRLNVFRRLREPAALNYLVLTVAGLLVYFLMMSSKGNDAGALFAIVLAIPGVLLRWVVSPALVLILTTYLMYDPAFYGLMSFRSGGFGVSVARSRFEIEDVVLAASLLAYLIGHFRLTGLIAQGMPEDPTPRRPRDSDHLPRRPASLVAPDELPMALAMGAGCCVVGQIAWTVVTLSEKGGRESSLFAPGTDRFFMVAWGIGSVLMAIAAVLTYLQWSRMTPAEADVALRDTSFQEMKRETDRLHRWRKWYRERVARKRRAGK